MRMQNCWFGFVDQGSLVKIDSFSLSPNQKNIEIKIKPIAGFSGDNVLSGLKTLFFKRSITLPIGDKEYVREIVDNKLYPVFGYGIQGTSSGRISVTKITTQNILHRRISLANEKIGMLEDALKSYASTVKFLSQSSKDRFYEIMEMVKEAKKIAEPVGSEYFTYTYPRKEESEEIE